MNEPDNSLDKFLGKAQEGPAPTPVQMAIAEKDTQAALAELDTPAAQEKPSKEEAKRSRERLDSKIAMLQEFPEPKSVVTDRETSVEFADWADNWIKVMDQVRDDISKTKAAQLHRGFMEWNKECSRLAALLPAGSKSALAEGDEQPLSDDNYQSPGTKHSESLAAMEAESIAQGRQ